MRSRRVVLSLVTAVVLVLAGACGGGATSRSGAGGQALTIAVHDPFVGFLPTDLAGGTIVQSGVMRQLYDTLVTVDDDRRVRPRLAESWRLSADQKTLTFRLRSGLRFSDGSALKASDVVWNIEYAQKDATAATAQQLFLTIAEATAPDARTLQVTFKKPLAAPYDMFDYLFVAKPQKSKRAMQNAPIGSGPFQLDSWQPASSTTLVPNRHFWRRGAPKLTKVTFRVAGSATAAKTLFTSKQANFLYDSSWQDYAKFAKDEKVQTLQAGSGADVEMFLVNTAAKPLQDVRVRQALAATLDRAPIIDAVYHGKTEPWCLPWPKGTIGFEASPQAARTCAADPAEAKRLLAEAGHPDGFSTTILARPGVDAQVAQIYQQQLAGVGITAKIDLAPDATTFFDKVGAGRWDILVARVARLSHDSASAILLGQPLQNDNVSNFSSKEYAALIDEVLHETTQKKRLTVMRKVNRLLLRENFFIPVTTQTPHYVFAKDIEGVRTTLDGYLVLEDVSIA